jgi:hypothetical protein
MEQLQPLAIVIMVLIGYGIMFQVIRPKAIWYFILFLIFLPFLTSAFRGSLENLFGLQLSWKGWLIAILVVLIGLRLIIDRLFRRR